MKHPSLVCFSCTISGSWEKGLVMWCVGGLNSGMVVPGRFGNNPALWNFAKNF